MYELGISIPSWSTPGELKVYTSQRFLPTHACHDTVHKSCIMATVSKQVGFKNLVYIHKIDYIAIKKKAGQGGQRL